MVEEKIIDKIRKLFALAESEEAIGNKAAADTINEKATALLIKYKLEHKDVADVQETIDVGAIYYAPVMGKTFVVNPFVRANAKNTKRIYWFEQLAKVVANAFFCKASVDTRSAEIFFYGLDMDREIAVLVFQKFAERANTICKVELDRAKKVVGTKKLSFGRKEVSEIPIHQVWLGDDVFENSFHKGFRETIAEVFAGDGKEVSSAVEEHFSQNSTYYERDYFYSEGSGSKPFEGDEIAVQIGIKYAKRVCKKVSAGSVAGENGTQALQAKAKSNFSGETIIIMDDSGSMADRWGYSSVDKIQQAKDGTLEFASMEIGKGKAVGLIKFGNEPTILLYPQLTIDKLFKSAVSKLDGSSGGTEMAKAITAATQSFKNHKIPRTICLVTDGQPTDTGGEETVFAAANEAKRIGIEIATVGCGNASETFLKRLASREGLGILVSNNDIKGGMRKIAGMLGA